MKQVFSTSWKASKQPRKQRKYSYNAPLHTLKKFLAAPISKELKKKYGIRNLELKKGDEVIVLRGKNKKKHGKISEIKTDEQKVALDGIQKTKKDGTKVNVWFHPSKLKLVTLDTSDGRRLKRIKKKQPETTKNKMEKENAPKKE